MSSARRKADRPGTWEKSASLLRIVAHPVRLRILSELTGGARCVMDLNELAPISQPVLSQHMAALRRAELVSNYARGTLRCYYLTRPTLAARLLEALRSSPAPRAKSRTDVLAEIDGRPTRRTRRPRDRRPPVGRRKG
jgi:ArsR family transcriptional regulator